MHSNGELRMIENEYYIGKEKKLLKKFDHVMRRYCDILSMRYDSDFSDSIQQDAPKFYQELIPNIPFYDAASYQEIIILNSQIIAMIRVMEKYGKTVEDTLKVQIELFKEDYEKIPSCAGKIFTSSIGGFFLNRLANKITDEGWHTEYKKGNEYDDFDVSIVTKNCGLVRYVESENMPHYSKYCNFSDFIMFNEMNIGLTQPMEPTNGNCVFCMKHKGHTKIPSSLDIIYSEELKKHISN
jgi:hypothetical protein